MMTTCPWVTGMPERLKASPGCATEGTGFEGNEKVATKFDWPVNVKLRVSASAAAQAAAIASIQTTLEEHRMRDPFCYTAAHHIATNRIRKVTEVSLLLITVNAFRTKMDCQFLRNII